MKSIAIMQPTYLPWMGYFDLIDRVDYFVFLDTVQFEKQSWQQRNRIRTLQGWSWLSVPVFQKLSNTIQDVRINNQQPWCKKHWRTIKQSYEKTPYWNDYATGLQQIYEKPHQQLSTLNIEIIKWMAKKIQVKSEFFQASMIKVPGKKVDLLINICHYFHAERYISPDGSSVYIETDNRFLQNGIELSYQRYEHPEYRQYHGGFVSHMTALDLIFNIGPDAYRILRSPYIQSNQEKNG